MNSGYRHTHTRQVRPDFYLCMKIGDDIVSDGTHYPTKKQAEAAREALLDTPTMKCQDRSYIRPVVMHHVTLTRLLKEGVAVKMATLKANELKYGWNVASASQLYTNVMNLKHLFGMEEMKRKADWN